MAADDDGGADGTESALLAATPARPRVVGARPRPRVLLVGDELPHGVVDAVRQLAPVVEHVADLTEVRQAEWDVVVTGTQPLRSSGNWSLGVSTKVRVLAFADGPASESYNVDGGRWAIDGRMVGWRVSAVERLRCNEFPVKEHGDADLDRLVAESLIPAAQRRADYWTFNLSNVRNAWSVADDADGHPLACVYLTPVKSGPSAEVVVLPADIGDPDRWVRWLFRRWRNEDRDTFASLNDWDDDPTWLTVEELAARAALSEHDARRAEIVARLDEERQALADAVVVATDEARAGDRQLLTGEAGELVAVVTDVLERLGFVVEPVDSDDRKGDSLEDLRVTDPDAGGWEAIVEVRSYKKGAQQSDFLRLARFAARYQQEKGRLPDARWYIVNQFRESPPDSRPPVLQSSQADVAVFAEDLGLVIDTSTLFRIAQQLPALDRTKVRELIRTSTGVLAASKVVEP